MLFNGIELDPARNPAVLDTYTWDPDSAVKQCKAMPEFFEAAAEAVGTAECVACLRGGLIDTEAIEPSVALRDGVGYFLLKLADQQRVFVAAANAPVRVKAPTMASFAGGKALVIPVNTETMKWYVTEIAPQYAPRAFGPAPRLGIGGRQTTAVWPGIIQGLRAIGGPAETIQNSAYRELAPMDMILSPPGAEVTYLPGHGSLSIGHTGSSIEGFWLSGVLTHIESGCTEPFGADLDHVPVKSADVAGIARAKHLIDCGRHFSFFTLDTSFLFDFSKSELSKRYDAAIDAAAEMYDYITQLKHGERFDFEFSLDEGPAITEPDEMRYVLSRLARKGVKVAFIAPNVGFEKRIDYRKPDGVAGLQARVRKMSQVADEYGALLDFHSGSDKSPDTYRAISAAAGGRVKLKVSGKLQLILAEVMAEVDPEFFNEWWDFTLVSAKADAEGGSAVAAEFVKMVEDRRTSEGSRFTRSPKDRFFTDFSFGMVGAKDEAGRFLHRSRFYPLKAEVQSEYTKRVVEYMSEISQDLGLKRN